MRTGDRDIVELLMEASPGTLEKVSNNRRSVLHTASLAGHDVMVRRILETSLNMVNSQDECCQKLFDLLDYSIFGIQTFSNPNVNVFCIRTFLQFLQSCSWNCQALAPNPKPQTQNQGALG